MKGQRESCAPLRHNSLSQTITPCKSATVKIKSSNRRDSEEQDKQDGVETGMQGKLKSDMKKTQQNVFQGISAW